MVQTQAIQNLVDNPSMKRNGFTLSELLVALAILGVIATFTIPKILDSQQDGRKIAVFKETLSSIIQISVDGVRFAEFGTFDTSNIQTYYDTKLNYSKRCATDPDGNGCFPTNGSSHQNQGAAYVLHNGVMITSVNGGSCPGEASADSISIDWNGLDPPNTYGDDEIAVCIRYADSPTRPGTVVPLSTNPVNQTLWDEIWR